MVKVGGKWALEINGRSRAIRALGLRVVRPRRRRARPAESARVARKLSELNVPTIGETTQGYAKVRGCGEWGKATVQRMLGNEIAAFGATERSMAVNATICSRSQCRRSSPRVVDGRASEAGGQPTERSAPAQVHLSHGAAADLRVMRRARSRVSEPLRDFQEVNLHYQCRATRDEHVRECTLQRASKPVR